MQHVCTSKLFCLFTCVLPWDWTEVHAYGSAGIVSMFFQIFEGFDSVTFGSQSDHFYPNFIERYSSVNKLDHDTNATAHPQSPVTPVHIVVV